MNINTFWNRNHVVPFDSNGGWVCPAPILLFKDILKSDLKAQGITVVMFRNRDGAFSNLFVT
jgi:hypothetical protein